MSKPQILDLEEGRYVVVAEDRYRALCEAAEDATDTAAIAGVAARIAAGEERVWPGALVARLVAGDNPVRVWREHRGTSVAALAAAVGVSSAYIYQIERGERDGTAATIAALADALDIDRGTLFAWLTRDGHA